MMNGNGHYEEAALQRVVASQAYDLETLTERLAELELALEDTGWLRIGDDGREFSTDARRRIVDLGRMMALKNPLVKRGIQVQVAYVWGGGVTMQGAEEDVDQVVQAFLDDEQNQAELTSHQAREQKERELQTDGNVFFVLFPNALTGRVRVRTIPVGEITDIVTNPDDKKDPWYYKREWTEVDSTSGTPRTEAKTAYYPDWRYTPKTRPAQIGGNDVLWQSPIYHVKVGGYSDWKFGCSEVYAAIDWARAYKEFLEDWATFTRALSRYAHKLITKGGKAGVAAAKARLGTTLGVSPSTVETNPPATTGATWIGAEGNNMEPFRIGGANVSMDDGRRMLLMVAAAQNLPECYAADTEVLTERGFMRHDEWQAGTRIACYNPDTSLIEWHEPNDLRAYYYNGEMIHFRNQQTDILVTPNHRMWTAPAVQYELLPATGQVVTEAYGPGGRHRVADGAPAVVDRSWRIETADAIASSPRDAGWQFTSALRWAQPEQDTLVMTPIGMQPADAWARFIGYWIAEGCVTASEGRSGEFRRDGTSIMRTFRRIALAQKPGPVLEAMKDTLRALDLPFTTTIANAGVVNLVVYHKALWWYLRSECGEGSETKHIPHDLLYAGAAERHALYSALMDGDGGRSGGSWRYSTISPQLADDMQVLANSLGYGASITQEVLKTGRVIHRVWIRTRITSISHLKPKHVHRIPYAGMVYCFNVPHGIYVTRRNGRLAIQGNTFYGDVSVGTLATANSLDRPTELQMLSRQALWSDVHRRLFEYVLLWAVKAPKGALRGKGTVIKTPDGDELVESVKWTIDPTVQITFPPIVAPDREADVGAITEIATGGGKPLSTMDSATYLRLTLTALGIDNIDALIEQIQQAQAEEEAQAAADAAQAHQRAMELAQAKEPPLQQDGQQGA